MPTTPKFRYQSAAAKASKKADPTPKKEAAPSKQGGSLAQSETSSSIASSSTAAFSDSDSEEKPRAVLKGPNGAEVIVKAGGEREGKTWIMVVLSRLGVDSKSRKITIESLDEDYRVLIRTHPTDGVSKEYSFGRNGDHVLAKGTGWIDIQLRAKNKDI